MAQLLVNPKSRFFDSNGEPLSGGKLFSYAAGTSTLQATYVDRSETTTNSNPVILDANGEANVWIGSSAYKFVLKNSYDIVQWTVDNVASINDLAINTSKLADGSVNTQKLADGAVTTAKLADGSVASAKLADGSVLTAKFGDASVTTAKIADLNVTSIKMADSSVITAKLGANAVTRPKMASVGEQSVTVSGFQTTTVGSPVDVTGSAITITSTGRPIRLELIGESSSASAIVLNASASSSFGFVNFVDGTTVIASHYIQQASGGATSVTMRIPASSCNTTYPATAGTRTFKVQLHLGAGVFMRIEGSKFMVYEL